MEQNIDSDNEPKRLFLFPDEEEEDRQELLRLFGDWRGQMQEVLPAEEKCLVDGFVSDGFYPHYFSQPIRILFVGRECLNLWGLDYLEILLGAYRESKKIGKQHLNQHRFCSRQLYVAFGLLNGFPEWKTIPMASEIGDTFATSSGISFAFMNVSKFSNEQDETGEWKAQIPLIESSVAASEGKRNFIEEEISLLKPNVVITMNLGRFLDPLGDRKKISGDGNVERFAMTSAGHSTLLLDAWHFSSSKDSVKQIYVPICTAVRDSISEGLIKL